jgi:hypothetical protein
MDESTNSSEQNNIEIVMRQTNYTSEEAKAQLQLYNNDINKIIRLYLNNGVPNVQVTYKQLSMNQQIYKEIRNFMDETELKNQ